MHTILVIEDYESDRERIRRILSDSSKFRIVAEAEDGRTGFALARKKRPSIVLLDFGLPDVPGLWMLPALRALDEDVVVLMISGGAPQRYVGSAFSSGCDGFLPKFRLESHLVAALESVAAESRFFAGPDVVGEADSDLALESRTVGWTRIPQRGRQAAYLGALGLTTSEIAKAMAITNRGVEAHRASLIGRLGLANLSELHRFAKDCIDPMKLSIQAAIVAEGHGTFSRR